MPFHRPHHTLRRIPNKNGVIGYFLRKNAFLPNFAPQKGRVWSTKGVNLKKCQKNYLIFSQIPGCMQKFSNFQGANFEIVPQYVTFRYIALFPNPYPMENTARRRGPPLARKKCGTKFSTTQVSGWGRCQDRDGVRVRSLVWALVV